MSVASFGWPDLEDSTNTDLILRSGQWTHEWTCRDEELVLYPTTKELPLTYKILYYSILMKSIRWRHIGSCDAAPPILHLEWIHHCCNEIRQDVISEHALKWTKYIGWVRWNVLHFYNLSCISMHQNLGVDATWHLVAQSTGISTWPDPTEHLFRRQSHEP